METYLIVLKDFQTFLKEKGQDTISFDDINLALIKEYETYLFNKKVKGERTTATTLELQYLSIFYANDPPD